MRSIPLIVLVSLAIAAIAWAITLTASAVWSYWASGLWCAIVIGIRDLPSQRGGYADNNAKSLVSGFPDRLAGTFLVQSNSRRRIRRQPHVLPFDLRDQRQIDEMVITLVASFATVGLGELDPAVFDTIDDPDMKAVRPDHGHTRLYGFFPCAPTDMLDC